MFSQFRQESVKVFFIRGLGSNRGKSIKKRPRYDRAEWETPTGIYASYVDLGLDVTMWPGNRPIEKKPIRPIKWLLPLDRKRAWLILRDRGACAVVQSYSTHFDQTQLCREFRAVINVHTVGKECVTAIMASHKNNGICAERRLTGWQTPCSIIQYTNLRFSIGTEKFVLSRELWPVPYVILDKQ